MMHRSRLSYALVEPAKRAMESISRINRQPSGHPVNGEECQAAVKQLRERGFVTLDHLVGTPEIKALQKRVNSGIESVVETDFPCLAQNRIDPGQHQDLIDASFRLPPEKLAKRGITFDRSEVESYKQVLKDFNPSTLTLQIPDDEDFFNCWLDDRVMAVIEGYMGFVPHLVEAYVRRNFPARFRVMNHNWHRDSNHPDFLVKAFIFFTDCDIDTGAHHYIAGSIQDPRFRDKVYYTDEEVNAVWPVGSRDHMVSTVPAGTIIIEDTRGMHKAGIPKRSYRDLGYAVFSPPNFFRTTRYYTVDRSVYGRLSAERRRYIPRVNLA